ncbi:hypothetical protein AWB76_01352 [Caballeronia temeraria]|uniref:O-antigen polymerase n=1 Tax=Caballeronia temeraria TaxID=1777137 RepID=A0A157ZVN1_9BURK|nr:hypothetical protein [Caballeronia temeraria]SAK49604.1 hypothetical protein AWB76_01352 [Caballeronia temeraria]
MARSKIVNSIFWATVLIALLYSSYRYPLQINSAQTSPTYSDTPPFLQAAKYLLLAAACAVIAVAAGGLYIPRRKLGFIALYLALLVCPFIHLTFDGEPKHLAFAFVAAVAFFVSLSVRAVTMSSIDAFMKFTLYLSLLVNLIQIILFYSIGRLPALAYEDTLSVRFGSFLDDPNGFGALLFLLLGYAFCSPRTLVNRLCILGVILSIVFSQSLTAIAFLVFLILLWGLMNHFKATVLILMIACLPLLMPVLFGDFRPDGSELLDVVLTSKEASSDAHFASFKVANLADFSVWILGADGYSISESWWVTSLNNYGLIWTAALLAMFSAFMWRLYNALRETNSQRSKRVLFAALLFSIYFVVASANLPFPTVFPINFIFMLLLCLFMLKKVQEDEASR